MRLVVLFSVIFVSSALYPASYTWDPRIVHGATTESDAVYYSIGEAVRVDEKRIATVEGPLIGYEKDGRFYLKQQDHKTTPMPVDNNYWVVAYYGDILGSETIDSMTRIELCDWYDDSETGGTLISNSKDLYLGFKTPTVADRVNITVKS